MEQRYSRSMTESFGLDGLFSTNDIRGSVDRSAPARNLGGTVLPDPYLLVIERQNRPPGWMCSRSSL